MSPSSLPPPGRREHCPGELLLLSDRPTVPHGIERPRQLPGTICAPSAEREMSTPHPPAGSGTSTPITAGRSPPCHPGGVQRESSTLWRDTAREMSEENVEIARRAYEAFNRSDPQAMVADLAPNFEYATTG